MNVVKGKITPLRDNVLVVDMSFNEQKTASGIVIRSDDGKSEGVNHVGVRYGQLVQSRKMLRSANGFMSSTDAGLAAYE